ncbi:MAG: valine--tRNA ligase [Planctomycetota bacterium]|jgi:valyl-tRNA synthetase
MTDELPKAYEPHTIEHDVRERWDAAGAFAADPAADGDSYAIVIPPPNVTAALHTGHALNNTLQDVLIRYHRMAGDNTLWMPGTDHAGIATQTVVEKRILAEENKRRTEFGRDEFVARVQAWKDEYEDRILNQLKLMGCSCDWDRIRFTMDDTCARAVREVFFKLFADGLIYRGKRLVNWDPATQTVLADDEVEHQDVAGHFWYLRYPLAVPVHISGTIIEHVTVATTRPETMLGDTAVAMNPKDPLAEALVDQTVRLPLVGREIPIILDDHVVLPNPDSDDEKAKFSTGFLKVTPAHDPDDWQIGQRRVLSIVNVMAPDGTISDRHGWDDCAGSDAEFLLGMDRFEARKAIIEWFKIEGLLEDVREYTHPVGHSYRSHVPIEPYLSDQWYIAVKEPLEHLTERFGEGLIDGTDVPLNSLAGLGLKPLLDGRVRFVPDRYAKTYQTWLENLRDWPISRQLWWGHRIPVWSRDIELPADVKPLTTDRGPDAQTCAAIDSAIGGPFGEALAKFPVRYVLQTFEHSELDGWVRAYICLSADDPDAIETIENAGFVRDEDVLDTWFSSALWPFSTMGWPDETPELAAYYPSNVLSTARDIITLWVSRMVMMGQYCMGDIPFPEVFIHAMIQDGEGRKMSKSLNNGIDPLDIIDSHGADAMRFTLVSMTTQTQDVRMPVTEMTTPDGRTVNSSPKFDLGRNFCNKLWNAARFAMMNLADCPAFDAAEATDLADRWMLSRLATAVRDATAAIADYRYNELADGLYHFMWDDVCDWYLEIAKARINAGESTPKAIVALALDTLLRLLHPICPFITEAIWAKLNETVPHRGGVDCSAETLLVRTAWPARHDEWINAAADKQFESLQELVRHIRNVRKEHDVPPSKSVDALVEASGAEADLITANADLLQSQAQLAAISAGIAPADGSAATVTVGGIRLHVLGVVDREAELGRLTKQRDQLAKGIAGIEKKLASEGFLAKAPEDVVQRERERLTELTDQYQAVQQALDALDT